MKYIEDVLGIKTHYDNWEKENNLPYFLIYKYSFQIVYVDRVRTLFIYPKTELENIVAVKKHIARLQKEEMLPVVLVLNSINRYKRGVLIAEHIPFIVSEKQIYLPFMGVSLEEKYDVEIRVKEKFQPSAQLMFFYYLYQHEKSLYTSEVVRRLGFSAMTITRAAKQLVQMGLFEESKDGVQKVLTGKLGRRELFEKARPYLFNPVRKRVYIQKTDVKVVMPLAGLSALSENSMLNPPELLCFASEGLGDISVTETLINSASQVEVELWKYNPTILGTDNQIDVLSLAMSLDDNVDERVEGEIEILLERVWSN